MSVLLETQQLGRQFGGLKAVDGVDFHIDKGEIVSIIGPNGAGKTTFFNLITAFFKPTSGHILFNGEDITKLQPHQITQRGIARTFQNIRVFGGMSVLENVIVGAHCRTRENLLQAIFRPPATIRQEREVRERALQLLGIFGEQLTRNAYAPVQAQSYANRRRTEIARALATEPQLLLLDEPTAGMNPIETTNCIDVIRRLRDSGLTIMLIEHKLKVVMSISDRVVVLDYGVKIAEGKPEEVRRNERVIEAYLGRKAAAET